MQVVVAICSACINFYKQRFKVFQDLGAFTPKLEYTTG